MKNKVRQYLRMFRAPKKFVAILLAIWFPLFSGNALAMHAAMGMGGDDHQTNSVQQTAHQAHQDKVDVHQDQAAPHHEAQNSGCNNCSVCHLACCGYINAAMITLADIQLVAATHPFLSTPFLSFTSAPLDPPPLVRV